jgi:probable F420-dependent oxidoreductase
LQEPAELFPFVDHPAGARPTLGAMDLGRVGIWTGHLDSQAVGAAQDLAREIEALGYGAIWLPEAVGRDPFVHSTLLLGATERIVLATGIASIYARDAIASNAALMTVTDAFPERFLLGLGVSHQPMVEGARGHDYSKPFSYMQRYLDGMDQGLYFAHAPSAPPRRCLAALGPKMLKLAAERTSGAHPYFQTPEHTRQAREIMGPDSWLMPEQMAVLSTDPAEARAVARQSMAIYLGLPNYTNNLKRLGFTDDDIANGGSDRLVDAIVVWGDEAAVAARVREQHDAGADHVCVQVLTTDYSTAPIDGWRRLAPALIG